MIKVACTEVDGEGLVVAVSKPNFNYLSNILPEAGFNLLELGDGEVRDLLKSYLEQIFKSDCPLTIELNINHTLIELTAHCISANKAFIYWKALIKNNTPHKPSRAHLEDTTPENRLDADFLKQKNTIKRFTDNLPLVVFEMILLPDGSFRIGFVNKEMQSFYPELDIEAINADNFLILARVHPEDKQKLYDFIKASTNLQTWDIEYRFIKNEEIRWVKAFGRPELNEQDNTITLCCYLQDITERRKIQERLNLVDFVFKKTSVPILIAREDSTFFDFNDAALELHGYTAEEMNEMRVGNLVVGYKKEEWTSAYAEVWSYLKTHKTFKVTVQHQKKDGTIIDVEIRANYIKYGDMELNCSFVIDITDKKKADEAIKRSNERYEYATLATHDIVWETDLVKDTLYFGSNFTTVFGHETTGIEPGPNNVWRNNIHPDDRQKVIDNEAQVISGNGDQWVTEYRFRKANGEYAIVLDRGFGLKDENGKVVRLIGAMQDITEKKKIEEELRRSNERYECATIATSDIVWEHDLRTNLLYYSNNFTTVFGHPLTEKWILQGDMNNVWWRNIHPDDYEKAVEFEKQVLDSDGSKWESEYRLRKADGTYALVLDRGFAMKDENGKIIRWIGAMQDITEKRKIEDELKRSNERYEYATLATSDVIWETDLIADTLYISKNFSTIFGHDAGGVMPIKGSVWRQFVHPDDLLNVLKSEAKVIKGDGDRWECEYRFKKADGNYAIVLDRSFAMKDENGKVVKMIGAMQDITEKKKIEEELKRSNERYEYATRATSDVVWEADLVEKTYYLSKNFSEIFGHKSGIYEDLRVNEWSKNVHPDDLGNISQATDRLLKSNSDKWTNEYRLRKANGEYAHVIDNGFLVKGENGNPVKLIGALNDVTVKKREEERIKLFQTVIENTTDAIIIRDAKKLKSGGLPILYVNDAFAEMTGYSFEEVKGKTLKFLNGPDTDELERQKLRLAMDNFQPARMEVVNYKKNGEKFWANISVFPVANTKGEFTHWVSIQRDVTVKRKAEEEKEHLINDLIYNNKELKQFGYITTHNLRAPLTNLLSICRMIDIEKIEDLRSQRLIDGFKQSTLLLNETLNDLIEILIIKENRNLPTASLSFAEILNKAITSISNTINDAGAIIETDFSKVGFINFSHAYLESIFLNLLTNSIKYAHPARNPEISIRTEKGKNDTTKLFFSDNGIGMEMKRVKDRIFGLYQRFHNNSDSKGIGLYLIHSQITALGGTIEVESEVNVGTTFIITFK